MKQNGVVFQPGTALLFFLFLFGYFLDISICFRARKVTGPLEKRAPGLQIGAPKKGFLKITLRTKCSLWICRTFQISANAC